MAERQHNEGNPAVSGERLGTGGAWTLIEVCRVSGLDHDHLTMFISHGVVEPLGHGPEDWRFSDSALMRVKKAARLQRDLGIDAAGIALALDLLDEIARLRAEVSRLHR
jgi:chaperone modulatory protein CbpM